MNKIRKTLVVVFSALFVLCMALFAAGCNETNTTAEDPEAPAQSYSVSVDVNDASLGDYTITEASEDGGYAQGSLVTVTVSPKADYEAEVYVNGEAVALENNAASFSVEADTTVQVKYTYKIVANASVTGGKGTVSLSAPADGSKYASGESVTVTATPEAGYTLKSLTVNGATLLAAESDGAFVATFDISEKSYVFAEFVALRTVTIVNDADKGAVDVKLADGTPLKDGDLVAEGTELTLTVKERGSNTVKAVYVAGAYTALNGGKATFTVKGDTEVKVLYNTYYYITIPDDSEGGTITLTGGEKVGNLGYLEGTVLTLSVTVNPGYTLSITKLVGGEEEAVELTNGKYVFTVTEAVEFNIVFAEGTYSVTTEVNNTKYGTVALVDAPEEGYAYNATATLTVTPNPGYTVDYITVNGNKITVTEPAEGEISTTYEIDVKGDTQVFVCFAATERYTVSVELGQLFAQYSAEEDAEFLAALKAGITLGGNTVKAKDEFISLECYEGQEVVLAIAADPEDGFKFFYYENDAKERTLYAGEVTLTVTGDISIRLTAEVPAKPTVTLGSAMGTEALGQATSAELLGDYEVTPTIVGNNYTFTLDKLENKLIGATAYLFKSWTVMQGTKELTANSDGTYTIPYENNADNLALTITANWVVGYKIPVDGYEIQEGSDTVATARIVLAEGTLEGMIGDDRYAEAGSNADITITPKPGYRVTAFMFTLANSSAGPDFRITNSELGAFTIGAQPFLTGDLTYGTVSAQKIYKVSTESANVTLTVTGTDGKVNQYKTAEGKVEAGQENVYWVDAETSVSVTVTAGKDCYLTKVNDVTSFADENTYSYTVTPTDKTGDITITAETAPYLSAKVTFEKAEGVKEAYTTEYSIYFKRGGVTALYTGSQHLKAGDVLTLELQGVRDFADILVTLNGTEITHKEDPTKENIYVYTLDALKGDVEVKVTLKPALDFSFPDPEETTGGSTTPAPVQGAWKNLDDESDSTLKIDAHAVTINGEAVTEIKDNGKTDGDVVYTLTTESGKYELTWFANQVGYILALEDVTPAPAPAGRRNAARAAGAVTYFVSPEYGQSSTYYAQFAQGDTAKLTDINWTLTEGTGEEATTSTIKITSDLGQVHVELDGENAQYVFCVKAGHYLFVIGTTAYDMTLTLDEEDLPAYITVNKVKYLNPNNKPAPEITEFRSVDMLKDGDNIQLSITLVAENYEDKDAVQADLKLVIGTDEFESYLVNVGEGYYVVFFHVAPTALHIGNDNSADVALKSAAAQKTYDKIVAVLGANHSATFDQDTYTLELSGEGAEQKLVLNHTHEEVVEKTVTFAASAVRLVDGKIRLDVLAITHGFSEEELKTAKLTLAGATVMAGTMYTANGQSNLFFDVTNVAIADAPYKIVLVLGLEGATTEHEVKAPAITPDLDTQTLDGKKYTLSINEGVLYLTVAEDEGGSVTPTTGKVTSVAAAIVEGGGFYIIVNTQDVASVDTLKANLKLKFGSDLEYEFTSAEAIQAVPGQYKLFFNTIVNLQIGQTYVITMTAFNETIEDLTEGAVTNNSLTLNGKVFTLSVADGKLSIAVTDVSTEYTVNVSATGVEGECGYTLTKDGAEVKDNDKVVVNSTLTLTVNVPETHKVTVTITGSTYTQADNVYTITVTADTTITIEFAKKSAAPEVETLTITSVSYYGGTSGRDYITIHMATTDIAKVAVAKYVLVNENDAQNPFAGKGFEVVGNNEYINIQINNLPEPLTFTWYNDDGYPFATATWQGAGGGEEQGTITGPTDVDLVQDAQGVWLIVKGTFEGYDEAGVKTALTKYFCDLQQLSGVLSGQPEDWSKQARLSQAIVAANITVSGTEWSVRFDLLNVKTYAYCLHFGPTSGDTEDVKIQGVQNKEVEYGGRKYSLLNKWGEAGQLNYWGCIGLRITNIATAETVTATSATLETTTSAVYFVLSGTYQNIDAGKIEDLLKTVYFDFQEREGTWTAYKFDRTVSVVESGWTIKFDITNLPVSANAFTGHFLPGLENNTDNPAENLTLTTEQLPDGTITATLGTKKYTLVNKNGSAEATDNWGCVSVKVEEVEPAPEVQTTVTFDVGEGGSPVESQTYGKNVTFNAPNPPTKSGYKFLYWYYLNGEDQEQVQDGFVPSDHEDEEHKLTLYAKWEVDGDLGTVTTNNGWNNIVYTYPETLNVGDVAIVSGDLTLNNKTAAKYRYDGIFVGIVKGATLETVSAYVAGRYDSWAFTNDQSGMTIEAKGTGFYDFVSSGWVKVTGETEPDTGDYIELIKQDNIKFKAIVNYIAKDFIELRYELTATFTPTTVGVAAGEHTFYQIYEIKGTDIGEISIGLCGERSTLANGKIEVKHFPQGLSGEELHVSFENYEGTLTEIADYKNNDTDAEHWWIAGENNGNGATDDINVTGDFAVVFVYDKYRDFGSPDLSVEFFDTANKYFNWEPLGDVRGDLCTTYTWQMTAREGFTAKVSKHSDLNGRTIIRLMRVGTKMQVSIEVYDFATGEMIYGTDAVCTNFTTDSLTVHLNGNTYWFDNVKAYKCTLAASDASSHAEEGFQLTKGKNVTFNGSVSESDDVVIKLDLGDSAIYFGKGGLSKSLDGAMISTGESVDEHQVTISQSGATPTSGKVSVKFTLSGSDLTVQYTVTSAGSGLDTIPYSYTATISGLAGESYTLSVAVGKADVLA